jgi:negative regulator of sigma E activity
MDWGLAYDQLFARLEDLDGEQEPWFRKDNLGTYMENFCEPELTNQSDALHAFSGILRRIEHKNSEIYH